MSELITRRELEASRHYYATELESEACLNYRAKLEEALKRVEAQLQEEA